MFLLLAMADVASEAEKNADPEENPLTRLFEEGNLSAETARHLVEDTLHREIEGVITQERALASERGGASSLTTLTRMALRWPDPQTIFKGPLGPRKLAAWSEPIELDQAEAIAEAWGGSVDALLLSAVCGALRNDLLRQEEVVEDLEFRAALPVNLRSWEGMPALGNRLGIVFLALPIGIADPRERFEEIGRRMAALRASPEALVSFRLFQTIGTSPAEIREMLLQNIGTKTTLVLTNVPGPRFPVSFAGKEVKGIVFWVPHIGRVALGINIFTYAGKIRLSLSTDAGIIPEPQTIVEAFEDVFDEMRKAMLVPLSAEDEERDVPTDAPPEKGDLSPEASATSMPLPKEEGDREYRCAARTRRGTRCKNPPRPGSPFCFAHRALSGATKPPEQARCQARTKAGRPCRHRARPGSSFCAQHMPSGG
ncbi:MAG: DUF1298 domain-containing protein [Deltaproteobacteria bacterium]|nr:MAG: DUF1298 domain-containing protein [Deltaproteobacteria bacterium]